MKMTVMTGLCLAMAGAALAGTNDIASLVQHGLFEEEANHQLSAAIRNYQSAIDQYDQDRQLTATAIFRLGECYRKLGQTNEARAEYERVVREFADQKELADASRNWLPAGGTQNGVATERPKQDAELIRDEELVKNNPDLVNSTHNGPTPLCDAINSRNQAAVKFLLEHGADPNLSAFGGSPLSQAISRGDPEMAILLLDHGANPNRQDSDGRIPMDHAVENASTKLITILLSHGANIEQRDWENQTPLQRAVQLGFTVTAETLLSNKANVEVRDGTGETPLFNAVMEDRKPMVLLLLRYGADINARQIGGRTPLHEAARLGLADMVRLLIDHHADINARGNDGLTPLWWASANGGNNSIARILLDAAANPNISGQQGRTPLVAAVEFQNTNLVQMLLTHGANPNLVDDQYRSALDHTTNQALRSLLIASGADPLLDRKRGIFVESPQGVPRTRLFVTSSNDINHFTLFDALGKAYAANSVLVPFPDFAHVVVSHVDGSSDTQDLPGAFAVTNCGANMPLRWGDIIQLPEVDHKVTDTWVALDDQVVLGLDNCSFAMVSIVVQGKTNEVALMPRLAVLLGGSADRLLSPGETIGRPPFRRFRSPWEVGQSAEFPSSSPDSPFVKQRLNGKKLDAVISSFDLSDVIHKANVLLISSDLSRVRLTRLTPTGSLVREFDLTKNPTPFVWLRNGDVIAISDQR